MPANNAKENCELFVDAVTISFTITLTIALTFAVDFENEAVNLINISIEYVNALCGVIM